MKFEFKKERNLKNRFEVFIKMPDGTHRNLAWLAKKTGIPKKTLITRFKNTSIKTLEEFTDPRDRKRSRRDPSTNPNSKINYRKYETKYSDKKNKGQGHLLVNIDGVWKTINEIHLETGYQQGTISTRLRKGIDVYNPRKSGKIIDSRKDDLWEGVSDEIRIACESGSNKALLAV